MNTRHLNRVSIVVATLIMSCGHAFAEHCVPVKGKILNNFTSENSTQGVVRLTYGAKRDAIRLKCALEGIRRADVGPSGIEYIHRISCDDSNLMPAYDGSGLVPVYSSVVLHTTGAIYPPVSPTHLYTFKETSVLLPGAPTRGIFFGATGGRIEISGSVLKSPVATSPAGSIEMTFDGNICYPSSQ